MILQISGKISNRANLAATISGNKKLSARIVRGGGGVSSYNDLTDLPSINGEVVEGDKTGHDYGLANLSDIPIIPPIPTYNILRTKLYENNVNPPTIALSDSVLNYDFILFDVFRTSYNTYHMPAFIYSKEQLIDIINNNESVFFMGWSSNNEFVCYKFTDASNLYKSEEGGWMLIRGIYGIKLGSIV